MVVNSSANADPNAGFAKDFRVSAAWLAKRLQEAADPIVVLETGAVAEDGIFRNTLREYVEDGHVPGARYADITFAFSDANGSYGFTLPSEHLFDAAATQLGLTRDVPIVIYDRSKNEWAGRLLWLFVASGHRNVKLLDGGLQAWKAEGGHLETGYVGALPVPQGSYEGKFNPKYFADTAEVASAISGSSAASVICALPQAIFTGEKSFAARKGHIPNSANVPFTELLETDNTLSEATQILSKVQAQTGLSDNRDQRIIVYCGAGIASSVLALGLVSAGYSNVAIYDGSLREWGSDPARPLVEGR